MGVYEKLGRPPRAPSTSSVASMAAAPRTARPAAACGRSLRADRRLRLLETMYVEQRLLGPGDQLNVRLADRHGPTWRPAPACSSRCAALPRREAQPARSCALKALRAQSSRGTRRNPARAALPAGARAFSIARLQKWPRPASRPNRGPLPRPRGGPRRARPLARKRLDLLPPRRGSSAEQRSRLEVAGLSVGRPPRAFSEGAPMNECRGVCRSRKRCPPGEADERGARLAGALPAKPPDATTDAEGSALLSLRAARCA